MSGCSMRTLVGTALQIRRTTCIKRWAGNSHLAQAHQPEDASSGPSNSTRLRYKLFASLSPCASLMYATNLFERAPSVSRVCRARAAVHLAERRNRASPTSSPSALDRRTS